MSPLDSITQGLGSQRKHAAHSTCQGRTTPPRTAALLCQGEKNCGYFLPDLAKCHLTFSSARDSPLRAGTVSLTAHEYSKMNVHVLQN